MVETLQHRFELDQLVDLVDRIEPAAILEIGAWEGGTLDRWLRRARDRVVVIDDEMRRADDWQNWAAASVASLHLIQGRSQDPSVIDAASRLGRYDVVFVDADHRYAAGKADWENYSPMVAPGGIIAFHDIRRYEHGDLDLLWSEIKQQPGRCTCEFHENAADWGGIGVVWM